MKEKDFWNFVLERQKITNRRANGAAPPWTQDVILDKFFFTNINRRLDRGTVFYHEQIAGKIGLSREELIWRTCVYRFFNRISTWQAHPPPILVKWAKQRDGWLALLNQMRITTTVFTSAHLVAACGREDTAALLDAFAALCISGRTELAATGPQLYGMLTELRHVGPFLGHQICRDLIERKIMTGDDWCVAGPGAIKGLISLYGVAPKKERLSTMQALRDNQPKSTNPRLDVADVEHALCEWSKYEALKAGRGKSRIYHALDGKSIPGPIAHANGAALDVSSAYLKAADNKEEEEEE